MPLLRCKKKLCRSEFVLAVRLVVLPPVHAATAARLQLRTATNRMSEIVNRVCEQVINSGEGKIGKPQ